MVIDKRERQALRDKHFPVPNFPTRIPQPVAWEQARVFVKTGIYVQRYGQKIPNTCTDPQYVCTKSVEGRRNIKALIKVPKALAVCSSGTWLTGPLRGTNTTTRAMGFTFRNAYLTFR